MNANFGMLLHLNRNLNVGAVLKTPFEADIKHTYTLDGTITFPDLDGFDTVVSDYYSESGKLTMPLSYGIGIAYRFSDAFTLSFDMFRTEWDMYIYTDADGDKFSPITGKPKSESDVDPTNQLRMGAEYLIITDNLVVPIRGGIFMDPAPSQGRPDDYYGVSFGSGITKGRFALDAAYQYRFGRDVGASGKEEWDFSQDVDEHTIYISMIIYF